MKASDKRNTKAVLYKKYKARCAYCNSQMKYVDATLDHWLPKALGGDNRRENLRLACVPCNTAKGDMHPSDWQATLDARQPSLIVDLARGPRA